MEKKIIEVKEYIREIEMLDSIINNVYWDLKTYVPKEGAESKGELLEYLQGKKFKLITSETVKKYIDEFSDKLDLLSVVDRKTLINLEKNYNETMKIPEDRYKSFVLLCSKSELAWEEAREKNDFEIFKPYLKEVIDYQKEFIGYWGYSDNKYNTLLDKYEPGITVQILDGIFQELKSGILEILDDMKKSQVNIENKLKDMKFDIPKQRELSEFLLETIGFDLNKGRLDESTHPFTIEFNNKDVRLTTHYYENDLFSGMYSTIHEGGHGIYEQNIDDSLKCTGLCQGVSMGIHESQSRFFENIIGRSEEFCELILPKIKELFPEAISLTGKELYKMVNKVEKSLIRTEADELTYSIHVIIRYEIEKSIFNDEVTIDGIKDLWNKKYKEYLGVDVKSDNDGVLQDIHWSDGSFGYFPSYALGNIYGAQILNQLEKDIPNLLVQIKNGGFIEMNKWLKENIHKHGGVFSPKELIKNICNEELDSKYFLKYLRCKYTDLSRKS